MLNRLLLALSLLSAMCFTQSASGQSVDSREEESVLEKRMRFDDARWFFSAWAHQPLMVNQRTRPDDRRPVSEYVREFVTEEQFRVLTDAYDKRLQAHLELSAKMYPYDVLESRARMVSQGQSQEAAGKVFPLPKGFVAPAPDECRKALLVYVREQDRAEAAWAAIIDEVLAPEQFAKFIQYFIFHGKAYLQHPLFQNYLGYSDTQQREIEKQLDLFTNLQRKVEQTQGDSLTDVNVQRAYYKAFTVLTPAQFQKLAPAVGMKKAIDNWSEVRARIKVAGGPVEENLGPLVDNIIKSFDK